MTKALGTVDFMPPEALANVTNSLSYLNIFKSKLAHKRSDNGAPTVHTHKHTHIHTHMLESLNEDV